MRGGGREPQKGGNVCVLIVDSCCGAAEANTTCVPCDLVTQSCPSL